MRTVATNSSDAPGTAKFILENLRRSNVYVVDNTVSTAKQRAELFSAYFSQHGGTVVGRGSIPKTATDLTDLVADVTAKRPDVLFFSGSANSSEIVARFFKATRKDFGAVPFVASGEIKADSKFTDLAGADLGTNVFASLAAADDFPGKADFTMRYQAAFGVAPGTYSATAHVCATVILDAIKRAGDPKDLADLRERIRAAAVDPSVTHPSVIGDFRFDENGDPAPADHHDLSIRPEERPLGRRGVHPLGRLTADAATIWRIVREGTDFRRNPRRPVLRPSRPAFWSKVDEGLVRKAFRQEHRDPMATVRNGDGPSSGNGPMRRPRRRRPLSRARRREALAYRSRIADVVRGFAMPIAHEYQGQRRRPGGAVAGGRGRRPGEVAAHHVRGRRASTRPLQRDVGGPPRPPTTTGS